MPRIISTSQEKESLVSDEERKRMVDDAHSQSGSSQGEQTAGLLDWIQSEADE